MIPEGYKQTEIGLIPEDWEVRDFGKVGSYYKGGGISMREVRPVGIPCIMYGDIYVKFDTSFKECDYRIDYDTAKNSVKASPQDLFFTASGETADDIGRCVSYQGEDDIYIGGDIIALHPSDEYDSLFLAYVQNSENVKKQKASFAQGHSVVHISAENIKKTRFAAPKYPEQRRIAEALSDVDELITSLEKLIEKKKALKQGVMQELLTGKRRLPGFSGEWKEQPLDKYGEFIRGVSYDPNVDLALFDNCSVCKLLRANNIVDNDLDIHEVLFVSNKCVSPKQKLQKGDIVIAMSSGSTIAIGKNAQYLHDFDDYCVGAFCAVFRSEISDYISYIFQSNMFRKQLSELLEGTSINNLNGTILGKMTFPFSDNNDERKGVCSVLDNIAKEINSLKDQQNKYKKIKSGMMSELLTGRIRLV